MNKNQKRVISLGIIIALIAGLGGVYLWQQTREASPTPTDNEITTAATIPLITSPESELTSATFARGEDSYTINAARDNDSSIIWQWEAHPNFILNQQAMRDKMRPTWGLNASSQIFEDATEINLADFGLAPPNLTITSNFADGTTYRLHIGELSVDLRHTHVMLEGSEAIYLIHNHTLQYIGLTLEESLDRRLPFFTFDMHYMRIARQGQPTIELGMEEAIGMEAFADFMPISEYGVLTMRQPIPLRPLHHPNLMTELLDPLTFLELGEVAALAPVDLTPFGLHDPATLLEIHSLGLEATLLFGNTFLQNGIPYAYVKFHDRPHVFKAAHQPIAAVENIRLFTIIDRHIALHNILDVLEISVTSQDPARNIEMIINHGEPNSFEIAPTINGQPTDPDHFRSLYISLIGISADVEIDQFTPETDPDFTITFLKTENRSQTLAFFPHDANFYAISVDSEDPWFVTGRLGLDNFFQNIR